MAEGNAPLPYSPLGYQCCRMKGQSPPTLLRRYCTTCCHTCSPRLYAHTGSTPDKNRTDKNKQTNKPTDNQTNRQTDNKQQTDTIRSALPVMDRGYFTLVVVNVLLVDIFPVKPNFLWRRPGRSASRELSPCILRLPF